MLFLPSTNSIKAQKAKTLSFQYFSNIKNASVHTRRCCLILLQCSSLNVALLLLAGCWTPLLDLACNQRLEKRSRLTSDREHPTVMSGPLWLTRLSGCHSADDWCRCCCLVLSCILIQLAGTSVVMDWLPALAGSSSVQACVWSIYRDDSNALARRGVCYADVFLLSFLTSSYCASLAAVL